MYEGVSRSPCKITELSCFFDDAKVGKKQKHRPYHVVRVVLSFLLVVLSFFICGIIYVIFVVLSIRISYVKEFILY